MLAASDEEAKERCRKRTDKRKVKRCIYKIQKKVRKMNEDVIGNRKCFWKEVNNAKRGKGRAAAE